MECQHKYQLFPDEPDLPLGAKGDGKSICQLCGKEVWYWTDFAPAKMHSWPAWPETEEGWREWAAAREKSKERPTSGRGNSRTRQADSDLHKELMAWNIEQLERKHEK